MTFLSLQKRSCRQDSCVSSTKMIYLLHNWSLFQQPICLPQWAVIFRLVNICVCVCVCLPEAASRAIVQFLEVNQSEEASRGWMLLTTINLLASSGQVGRRTLYLFCFTKFCFVLCVRVALIHVSERKKQRGFSVFVCSLTHLHLLSLINQQKIASACVRTEKQALEYK